MLFSFLHKNPHKQEIFCGCFITLHKRKYLKNVRNAVQFYLQIYLFALDHSPRSSILLFRQDQKTSCVVWLLERIERLGGTTTGHVWNFSCSYVQVLASLVRAGGLGEGKYWGIIREYWGILGRNVGNWRFENFADRV